MILFLVTRPKKRITLNRYNNQNSFYKQFYNVILFLGEKNLNANIASSFFFTNNIIII
jgi:hypothetical protein